ncbi:MAG: C69 family dipeptidase [Candidatus Latescibacter sp.]|nr:C69 family dipeptidase [Candidatus Latescibacter sp.]
MKKIVLYSIAFLLFVALSSFGAEPADYQQCFAIVAGRLATADGSVLFGHNEDNSFKNVAGMRKVKRMEHPEGELVTLQGGGRIPQVKTTWAFWWMQLPEQKFSDCFFNEHGVALVTDNCPSREDKPDITEGGIGGPILRQIVAERARTAREGVHLVGSLIEKFGYIASGRTLIICDPREGWLVAMVNGKHWVAERVPDDRVAVIANTYTIREVNLKDTRNFLGSADLIEYAVKRGWYDPAKGPFSFEEVYADPKTRVAAGNTHRQWSATRRLAAGTVPLPEEARLPFSVKPKAPLTVRDITEALRDHYENTPYETAANYQERPPHKRHTATICSPGTNHSSVFQLRPAMPWGAGSIWWIALHQPCSAPYIPIYLDEDMVPAGLAFGQASAAGDSTGKEIPSSAPAYQVFGRLAVWVDGDYASRIPALRKQWNLLEETNYSVQKQFEGIVLKEMKTHPDIAKELLGRYTQGILARAVQQAEKVEK